MDHADYLKRGIIYHGGQRLPQRALCRCGHLKSFHSTHPNIKSLYPCRFIQCGCKDYDPEART